MPITEQRLTKKQKKSLAFRTRSKKSTKSNGTPSEHEIESPADLALEDEGHNRDERRPLQVGRVQATDGDVKSRNKRKAGIVSKMEPAFGEAPRSLKRKRESDGLSEDDEIRKKVKQDESTFDTAAKEKDKGKQRFILFVGNLKFSTTVDAIKGHFSSCDPPPSIRLLTPKASSTGKQTTKSKGCAFLEFSSKTGLQQALKLHQSKLDGRMINVELTVGGGGKGEMRLKKLQERNKDLHKQREKREAKDKGESDPVELDRSQRYSATSGVGQAPKQKPTWTVGNVTGEKKTKSRRRPTKFQATGVNAIPVG